MTTERIQQVLTSSGKTPFYLFDSQHFADNIKQLKSDFGRYYSNYRIAYSYKTNAAEAVVRTAKSLRCYAEVVSPTEYNYAKSLWIEDKNIIYNGIIPDIENKARCAVNGGKVNIDNLNELLELNEYARENDIEINVGIRVFFELGEGETSKFGFDINGSEFKYITEHPLSNTKIIGLHCHLSGHRSVEDWKKKIDKMITLSKNFDTQYIDLGGNMYGSMDDYLSNQFSEEIPTFLDYARVVALAMKHEYPDETVQLITENGTSLVGDCVDVVAKVIGVKTTAEKEMFVCDTCIYDLGFLPKTKKLPYEILNTTHSYNIHNCDIAGYACTEEDILVKDYKGRIEIGDYVIFHNLGAYSLSMATSFIQPIPHLIQV